MPASWWPERMVASQMDGAAARDKIDHAIADGVSSLPPIKLVILDPDSLEPLEFGTHAAVVQSAREHVGSSESVSP